MNERRFLTIAIAGGLLLPAFSAQSQDAGTADKAKLEKAFPSRPNYSPYAGRTFPTMPLFGDTHLHTGFSMDAGAFRGRRFPNPRPVLTASPSASIVVAVFRSALAAPLLASFGFSLAGCAARADRPKPSLPEPPICFECFWDSQPAGLREELIAVYGDRRYDDPLVEAERRLILGRTRPDPALVCEAFGVFAAADDTDPSRRLLAAESTAFLATGCGGDAREAFLEASAAARDAGDRFKAGAYRAIATEAFRPRRATQKPETGCHQNIGKG